MAYGNYSGHNKVDKGKEGGSCNRTRCQASPALWWNHVSYSWYCEDCKHDIGDDPYNCADWVNIFKKSYPQFETREMMDARGGSTER